MKQTGGAYRVKSSGKSTLSTLLPEQSKPQSVEDTSARKIAPHLEGAGPVVPILAGGGGRLSAHIGILAALEELGVEFDHLVGVSGGSIVGALYAAGYDLEQISRIAVDTDFSQFLEQSLFSLLRSGGLSSGDRFEAWMDEKLAGACFGDLRYHFHVVATDVHTGMPVVLDAEATPDLPVSKAVRFSMSIPILFSFKPFRKHLLVDGSILSEDALQRDWSGRGDPVLCFRLRGAPPAAKIQRAPLIPLKHYLSLLIRTFLTTLSREYINDSFWHSTVIVDTGTVSPMDFHLTGEQKRQLYKCGYETAKRIVPMKLARHGKPSVPGPSSS